MSLERFDKNHCNALIQPRALSRKFVVSFALFAAWIFGPFPFRRGKTGRILGGLSENRASIAPLPGVLFAPRVGIPSPKNSPQSDEWRVSGDYHVQHIAPSWIGGHGTEP